MSSASPLPTMSDARLVSLLADWLPDQRWFGEKGRELTELRILSRIMLSSDAEFRLDHILVSLHSNGEPRLYQVPLAFAPTAPEKRRVQPLGEDNGVVVYDGLRDPRGAAVILDYLRGEQSCEGLSFSLTGLGHAGAVDGSGGAGAWALPADARGRLLGVEQSNSSLVYEDSLVVKIFRQVWPGINPDVELHAALTAVGCDSVAELRGWIAADDALISGAGIDDEPGTQDSGTAPPTTLAIAQEFLVGAADGWAMATASVRDLFAEADLLAAEVGTDFAEESRRLGATVAHVHADLAEALGTETRPGSDIAGGMLERLEAVAAQVPELSPYIVAAREVFTEVAELTAVPVQRIHGDLHLGQALRTPDRWVLIDFEGEPSAPLHERRAPDSVYRDVAGVLRSLDYAAGHALVDNEDRQRRFRATEWRERNVDAFCEGYSEVAGVDPRLVDPLLRAYELDKAIYEVGYEARNRPSWLPIPLTILCERLSVTDAG